MLLMTSNGLTSRRLCKAAKRALPAGARRAALVTTASVGFKERDYHVPRLCSELEKLGLAVDFFDFDHQPAGQLFAYQVVECIGGNPFYLVRRMREAHCELYLQELKSSGLFIGVSAGSLAMQESLELVDRFSPELRTQAGGEDSTGMGVTGVEILPHYRKYLPRFERFEERTEAYEQKSGRRVIRLDDGHGVWVDATEQIEIL